MENSHNGNTTVQVSNEIRVRRSHNVHLRYPIRTNELDRQVVISDLSVKELVLDEIPNVGNRILALAGAMGRSTGDGGNDPKHHDPRHPVLGVGGFCGKDCWFVSMGSGGAVM